MAILGYCDFYFVILLTVILYLFTFRKWHYWKSRGIPFLKPVFPIFGNMYDLLFLQSFPDITNRIYNKTQGLPFVGIYAFHTPVLFVRDLDLISKVLMSDFKYFDDRGFHFNKSDSLGRNLIHQKGDDWKYSRSKLTPCFSTSRVKSMMPIFKSKSECLVELVEEEVSRSKFVDIWDASLRFAVDVITSSTMGIDPDSLHNRKDPFREASRQVLGIHFLYHVFTGCFFPKLHELLRISMVNAKVTNFFQSVIKQVIEARKIKPHDSKDLFQTLLHMKEDQEHNNVGAQIPEIDDNFIAAQAVVFFLAGFESPGGILAHALYEIAKATHIQKSLTEEIKEVVLKHNNEVSFDALQEMKYLRQVIAETLRKYPPLGIIFRRCSENYTIPDTTVVVEKGTMIMIPLKSIHNDSNYYPNPERFDPERFSEDNVAARHNAAYLPFGAGLRVCPVVLFSHIEIRMAIVNLLLKFEVCLAEKTPLVLQTSATNFLQVPKGGIPLTFKRHQVLK